MNPSKKFAFLLFKVYNKKQNVTEVVEMKIEIQKTTQKKQKPDENNLGFGKYFTDHMFIMDYENGKGWHSPRIIPYGDLPYSPACMTFHYGQSVFEGMKAYKTPEGEIQLFRPEKNMERLNVSNERLCIPQIDEKFAVEAVKELVRLDADWIPTKPGTSLYIRPFIIATDAMLGVHPSNTYQFIIILSPVGSYYKHGISPVKIYVEDAYVRAVRGGMGFTKTAGNYAASLKAQQVAQEKGYEQVLWLDGVEQKYIEEIGAMNVFFKINGEVVTPQLNGSILSGITRMSTIELVKSWGIPMTERKISVDELFEAAEKGQLEEAFGTGTAAVISPIGELAWEGKKAIINDGKIGEISQRIYDTITGIQNGTVPDTMGWTVKL